MLSLNNNAFILCKSLVLDHPIKVGGFIAVDVNLYVI